MQKYFFIINYSIIILFGVYYFSKIKDSSLLKMFLIFLVYSFFTEVVGTIFAYELRINTAVIYNSWNVANVMFFSYFFYSLLKSTFKRKLIVWLSTLFFLLILIYSVFFHSYMVYLYKDLFVLGKILLIVYVLMYFSEVLNSDSIFNIKESMYFWISLGVFLYAIGFIPVYIIAELIDYQGIFRYVTFALNILISLCFITGFIVSKKEFNQ
jgi:hypothetical protein